ncbi:MAG: hypothetical protein ACI9OO_001333 [Bacteroidia bacterium]|jgi:hypothetical protein
MNACKLALWLVLPYLFWLTFFYRYHFIDGVNLARPPRIQFWWANRALSRRNSWPARLYGTFSPPESAFRKYGVRTLVCGKLDVYRRVPWRRHGNAAALVGGSTHDWNWLLSHWGLLDICVGLAQTLHLIAAVLVLAWYKAYQLQSRGPIKTRRKLQ